MSKNTTFISLFLLLFLCACNGNEATKIDVQIKQPRPLVASLTSVSVVNDRLVIRGTGLSAVTKIELSGESTSGSYRVESSTAHEIIAYASSAAAIGIGKTIDLLIGNAQAQAGYQISFELDDNSITAAKISSMGAATGQVLKFNGTNWVPTSLPNSQMYLGSFEADTNNPDLSSPSSNSGDYYIVSVAGTFNGISYDVGDWIISDGVAWQRIANAAPAVNSFEGRTGSVVLVPGDYVSLKDPGTQKLTGSSLEDIADVDMTGLAANKVLKYDGTSWVVADDLSGGGAASVGTTQLQDSSVTYQKISLTDGELPQAKVNGLVSAFTTVNSALAGKISRADLSATAPLVYSNTTGDFTVSAATTSAAGTMSGSDKTKLDSVTVSELGYLAGVTSGVQVQLDDKLATAGGTVTGNLIVDSQLQLKDGATANYVTLKAPASGTASYTLTFPATVGTANQVLTTNASGVLSWTTIGTATAVGGDLSGSVANATITANAVTSGKVLDGTLVDADLSPSAAIAQSKVANLTSDLGAITTSVSGKIGLINLSATAPLAYDNTSGAFTVSAATTSAAGTLSSSDKTKLDGLEALSVGDGLFERFSGVVRSTTCSAGEVLKWNAVGGWICGSDLATDASKLALVGGTLTGNLVLNTEMQLKDGATANYVIIKAPASGTTSYTLTLPPTVGTANQVLATNASGVLSWATVATSATSVGGDLTGTIASATIAADAVTSGKVLDGTLGDADINASAAIAQSKVANLTTDLSTINTSISSLNSSVSGKIGLTNLSATAPLVYNNTTGAFTVSAASGSAAGTMSAADKTKLDGVTATELGYVTGVTSAVQGQLDSKLDEAGGTLTGNLVLNTNLQLKDGAAANYVTLKAPASGTTSYTLTLPPTVGTANQVLATNASGVLSWATVATSTTSVGGDLSGTISSATIVADAVTSGKVLDGTLVDADINASAAIAQSKIANLTTDLSTINTNVSGKIGLTALSAASPLVYNNATGAFTVSAASGSAAGTLSAADKTKLDTLEALSASNGLLERFSGVIRSNTCSPGEVLKWNAISGWTCGADDATDATKLPLAGGTLTGNLVLNTEMQLKDGAAANYVTIKAPASGTTSYTLTLPPTVGTANQVLATNASGVLSWATVATSATSVGGDLTGTIASATIAADAVTSGKILDGTLVDADINASAAIAQSKIANLTSDLSTINTNVSGKIGLTSLSATAPLVYNNATGAFTVSAANGSVAGTMSAADKTKLDGVTTTELGYIAGVTSALQGQLDDKLPEVGGSMTGDLTLETQLKLKDGATASYVNLRAPASGTTSYTLTFPPAVGSANQVLTTNASGVLSWTTIGTATAVGGDLT
ncbi:MAG TPA: hypothetical protein VNJ01_10740, partial [Bacteriovoracaceae bacterium]|nr:hypothetical protein [Bacteriovoracaceae bacterium]